MSLFLKPPSIDPSEYLPSNEAAKIAAIRLTSPPGYWDDEIRQTLLREHPYVPVDRVVVNFTQKDDASGTAVGYISVMGCPGLSIPVIIKNRELSPLDLLVVRSSSADGNEEQGAGDMTDDKVMPLDEDTFARAMDAGPIGDVLPPHMVRGTNASDDGSSLRLPFRGRTVLASYLPAISPILGASEEKKAKFAELLGSNARVVAGFVANKTASIVDRWLAAPAPKNSVQAKLASAPIERGHAVVVTSAPVEIKTAEMLAANVFVENETTKTAVAFDAIDLAAPEAGTSRYLLFTDGTYCRAPEKVAAVALTESEEAEAVTGMLTKMAAASLRVGSTLVLAADPVFTAPAKLAGVFAHEAHGIVELTLLDGMNQGYKVVLDRRVKTAMRDDNTGTWIMPFNTKVLALGDYTDEQPMAIEKVATALERHLTDSLICNRGQFTLVVRGETFGQPQITEEKVAEVLHSYLDNADALIAEAKQQALESSTGVGHVRFGSNIPEIVEGLVKKAEHLAELPKIAKEALVEVSLPLEKAIKLAAAIGDPDGVDAVLGAGFLSEDNLAEFIGLADQFEDTVGKLARLLLAIRMGFPGDETATVVAMKALSRVAERLQSAGQEV